MWLLFRSRRGRSVAHPCDERLPLQTPHSCSLGDEWGGGRLHGRKKACHGGGRQQAASIISSSPALPAKKCEDGPAASVRASVERPVDEREDAATLGATGEMRDLSTLQHIKRSACGRQCAEALQKR